MRQESPIPSKIISGGQTGVDRAALDAAIALGIEHGGWCPCGRLAEDGTIPTRYNLQQTENTEYPQRTEKNVLDSDATLIICHGMPSGGTLLTVNLANRHKKPLLIVDLDDILEEDITHLRDSILEWLKTNHVETFNIAGSRESQSPGIYQEAFDLLFQVLREE